MPSRQKTTPAGRDHVAAGLLRNLVARAGLRTGDQVLELDCGQGLFSRIIAYLVGPSGAVVACDPDTSGRELSTPKSEAHPPWLSFRTGIPGDEGDPRFDLLWCPLQVNAQSETPIDVRVLLPLLRPGGLALFGAFTWWRPAATGRAVYAADTPPTTDAQATTAIALGLELARLGGLNTLRTHRLVSPPHGRTEGCLLAAVSGRTSGAVT